MRRGDLEVEEEKCGEDIWVWTGFLYEALSSILHYDLNIRTLNP